MLMNIQQWKTGFTALVFGMLAVLISAPGYAGIDEGIEYKLINPPVPTSSSDKVEVVEMFWYGCPHCYHFEPSFEKWKKSVPGNVEVIRVPAIFPNRPAWEASARAFYTAELLGVLDKIHKPLFDAIHKNHQKLFTKESLADFFEKHGVKKEDFNQTYDSFGVQMKVNRARDLTQRYGIDGVPTLVINGRYQTHGSLTDGTPGMLKVVNFLIEKEAKK